MNSVTRQTTEQPNMLTVKCLDGGPSSWTVHYRKLTLSISVLVVQMRLATLAMKGSRSMISSSIAQHSMR